MLKVNVVFGKNHQFLANVVFAKLAIGGGGGWGWFWLNIRNGSVEPFNSATEYRSDIHAWRYIIKLLYM